VAPASLALMIAIGIGLHNFGEGLAIGAEAASGALAFAVVLAIGFALHNMTEGFGIAAPLAGERPSWAFLGLAGLIGGGPTFLGTLVGMYFPSPALGIFFLSVAGGAIVYVVKELFHQTRRFVGARAIFAMAAVTLGFLLGLTTDLLVTLGGV
jgi:ZIP family zinc transporter